MNPIVTLRNIGLTYQSLEEETLALADINLQIEHGDFVAFVGPSGCGKSTLLSIIAGLLKPTVGEVEVLGERITAPSSQIGYMLQSDHLLSHRTIWNNALLGLQVRKLCDAKAKMRVEALFEDLALSGFKNYYPHELSGGMRQKAALIRTLALEPKLLLLDEPFSALDYQTRLTLSDEISAKIRQYGTSAILVTHDLSEAVSMSDRVVVFSKRPAKIKAIHEIEFINQSALDRRHEPKFQEYFQTIWKELDKNV